MYGNTIIKHCRHTHTHTHSRFDNDDRPSRVVCCARVTHSHRPCHHSLDVTSTSFCLHHTCQRARSPGTAERLKNSGPENGDNIARVGNAVPHFELPQCSDIAFFTTRNSASSRVFLLFERLLCRIFRSCVFTRSTRQVRY